MILTSIRGQNISCGKLLCVVKEVKMDTKTREQLLVKYEAPAWMRTLSNIPTHRIKASIESTPIERWYLPGIPKEFEVYIKREDLTGCVLSGNKVRGFEFIFAEAIKQGCTAICSAGTTHSNFVRTLALMASSLGMPSHFVIYADKSNTRLDTNLLLLMAGAHRYMIPTIDILNLLNFGEELGTKVEQLAEKIRKDTGESVFKFVGNHENSYTACIFGYLKVFDELLSQDVKSFSDIVVSCSGAVTTFGLAVGNHLNECNIKIHSMVTGTSKAYAEEKMNRMLRYVGLQEADGSGLSVEDICHMTEHLGAGFGKTTQEELEFLKKVAEQTGIILGSTYSGKAAFHLVKQLNEQPEKFKGKKILFIHTGGVFELFDGRMQNAFDNDDNVKQWKDVMDS
ncbi:uncharacterized protein [Amphiura filiformis]|uniref:uncharacterized protein n=1 Tax=Amphiura filiformis TaxID=82378 RepID=UPI003B21D2B2